ncbi:LLM class flavin-dependent oxidoreductase [Psychrobacillus sp. NEAU-3TGS]|uniref:LLM class flavin-dependent oxidoreductase n=1 Tax=Psychrobacillus sp. NEAU-3TGS TaxID=2995412 RepID=UPI002498B99A|nr:LLM class flavin-dependent oxidoreductase [Psychrobacillus sp. NEAU-3TGS]MDI2586809.1 LLM class flavin-dependent oxidoreductase [Psychrobacillus sp. NEAU-3TGS]
MKLSILDQSPISANQTAKEALIESMELAKLGESLGYTRYWITEHHDLTGLASSAPEVMLAYIGANTNTIRIGSGAVLLPHYKPFKVAEVYNTLATLFPNRVDVGLGRAPGGSAEATNALSDNFLQNVYKMPSLVEEFLHFLDEDFPACHEYSKISASPIPEVSPVPWLLGTGKKSALLAAENGLSYAFGHFMSEEDGAAIVNQYLDAFTPSKKRKKPEVIVTVSVICAETSEKAEEIAKSTLIWALQKAKGEGKQGIPSIEEAKQYIVSDVEKETLKSMKKKLIIGNPTEVKEKLSELQTNYKADEIMLNTIAYSAKDRFNSYRLIADEIL